MSKIKLVDEYCEGCVHLCRLSGTGEAKTPACTYIIDREERRPCPPGEGCFVKQEGIKGKVNICISRQSK